ncbi:MAG: hypothetical protein ACI4UO_05745 [Paludibacteraceae bacterium]
METYEIIASVFVGLMSLTFIGYGLRFYLKRDDEKLQAKVPIENKKDYYMPRVMVCQSFFCIGGGLYMSLLFFGFVLPYLKDENFYQSMIARAIVIIAICFLIMLVYFLAMNRWARKPKDEREDEERKNRE